MDNTEFNQPEAPLISESNYKSELSPVIGFGEWLATLIIMLVPILNFIMLIIWISEPNTNPNKVTWAKATLTLIGIQLIIAMFLIGTFIGTISHVMSSFNTGGLW